MKKRTIAIAVGAVVAVAAIVGGWLGYQRFVVGRASAAACGEEAAFGKLNVPDTGFVVLDEYGWGSHTTIVLVADGRVIENGKTSAIHPDEMDRMRRDLAASGIYGLGSGCYTKVPAGVVSDASSAHLWLVRDGVAYEYAWLVDHGAPAVLERTARRIHALADTANPKGRGR